MLAPLGGGEGVGYEWHFLKGDTRDSRLLNPGCAMRGTLAGQVVVSFRGLPGGSARRRRPTSFSNLLMVLSPAIGLPVCVGPAKSGDVPGIVSVPEEGLPRLRGRLESGGTD